MPRVPGKLWHGSSRSFLASEVKTGISVVRRFRMRFTMCREVRVIESPDILIVRGLMCCNYRQIRNCVSDSSTGRFVDADATLIEQWYLERFELLMDRAKSQRITITINMRFRIMRTRLRWWRKMCGRELTWKNLKEYILPTKTPRRLHPT